LIEHAERKEILELLLAWAKVQNPAKYDTLRPYHAVSREAKPPRRTTPATRTASESPEMLTEIEDFEDRISEIIHHNRCSDEAAFYRLMRAGLVQREDDVYVCDCELYKLYFVDKILGLFTLLQLS
jgi:hypothetical protein